MNFLRKVHIQCSRDMSSKTDVPEMHKSAPSVRDADQIPQRKSDKVEGKEPLLRATTQRRYPRSGSECYRTSATNDFQGERHFS